MSTIELLEQAIQARREEPERMARREEIEERTRGLVSGFSDLAKKHGKEARLENRGDTILTVPLNVEGEEEPMVVGINMYGEQRVIVWIKGLEKALFMSTTPRTRAGIRAVEGSWFENQHDLAMTMGAIERIIEGAELPVTLEDINQYEELLGELRIHLEG